MNLKRMSWLAKAGLLKVRNLVCQITHAEWQWLQHEASYCYEALDPVSLHNWVSYDTYGE